MTTKTFKYSKDNVELVFDLLTNYKSQGTPKEYDIQLDGITVVQRTNDLNSFYSFMSFLSEYTRSVCVRLFLGKSRKCDKYVLQQQGNVSPDPHMTTEDYIKQEVKKRLDDDKKEFEYTMLLDENRKLRKSKKKLKKKVQELEESKLNSVKELIQMATLHFGNFKPGDKDMPKAINGIPTEDILRMMDEKRQEMGDEMFGRCLSILLAVAMNPELIPMMEELIKHFEKERNEKQKKQ